MPTITFSNGKSVEAPEKVTPEFLEAVRKAKEAADSGEWKADSPMPAPPPGATVPQQGTRTAPILGVDTDMLRAGGSAAVTGALAVPALVGDAMNWAANKAGVSGTSDDFPASKVLYNGTFYRPPAENKAASWLYDKTQDIVSAAATAGAGATGIIGRGLLGGVKALAAPATKGAVTGLAGSLSADLANKFLPDSGAVPGIVGAVAGGSAAAGLMRHFLSPTNAAAQLREYASHITPEQWEKAGDLYRLSRTSTPDVPLDMVQALKAAGARTEGLEAIRNQALQSSAGRRLQGLHEEQPTKFKIFTDDTVGRMPGQVLHTGEAVNNMSAISNKAVEMAQSARTNAVEPLYQAAGYLPQAAALEAYAAAKARAAAPGASDHVKAAANEVMGKIAAELFAPKSQGLHALRLDRIIKDATGAYKSPSLAAPRPDAQAVGQLKGLAGDLRKILNGVSQETTDAGQLYAQITKDTVNPLKMRQRAIAGLSGSPEDREASKAILANVFASGVNTAADPNRSPVKLIAADFAKVPGDPTRGIPSGADTFKDGFKTWVASTIDKVSQPLDSGVADVGRANAANVQKVMFDNRHVYQGLKDGLWSSAKLAGLDPDKAVQGLQAYERMVRAVASSPQNLKTTTQTELNQIAGGNVVSTAAGSFRRPLATVEEAAWRGAIHKSLSDMDFMMATPQGIRLMQQLAGSSAWSPRALFTLQMIGAARQKYDQETARITQE